MKIKGILRIICLIFLLLPSGLKVMQAQPVSIFSLNNSLIDYNNQPEIFNEMVKSMGKEARWHARTQLGRTLLYHYNEKFLGNLHCLVTGIILFCRSRVHYPGYVLKS